MIELHLGGSGGTVTVSYERWGGGRVSVEHGHRGNVFTLDTAEARHLAAMLLSCAEESDRIEDRRRRTVAAES